MGIALFRFKEAPSDRIRAGKQPSNDDGDNAYAMSNTWRRIYIHLVWGTKHRMPMIDASREAVIAGMLHNKAIKCKSEMLAFGAVEDHVHLLVSLHVSANVAGLVRAMKSTTSAAIRKYVEVADCFAWQTGYAALSVEPRDAAVVGRYIVRQKEHHREQTTQAQWEPPLDQLGEDSE